MRTSGRQDVTSLVLATEGSGRPYVPRDCMPLEWYISDIDKDTVQRMASELGIHPITARVLINRDINTPDKARRYLAPTLSDIPDPLLITDMKRAVGRLGLAIERNERIAIFGDYDVDGVTGTALLLKFLRSLGADAISLLPSRHREGYGLTPAQVDELIARGASLIVTVDNGTRAYKAVAHAKDCGVDIVVTDHHDASGPLPDVPVVNPRRTGTADDIAHLSGCGVAFMLALALRRYLRDSAMLPTPEPNMREFLDFAALGTIADSVNLVGTNRIFAKHGLVEIARSTKHGINALLDVSGTDPARISTHAVAFQLAPRINAAGRLTDAQAALDLLLCDEPGEAWVMARNLDTINRKRQMIEEALLAEVLEGINRDPQQDYRSTITIASKEWHIGVIGIVAAKISERYGRPTVIISLDTEPARGSARAPEGINLIEALSRCDDTLVKCGGHAAAAGLSIEASRIDEFTDRFDAVCKELTPACTSTKMLIDAVVSPAEITGRLIEEISVCSPFGAGNPEPVLAMHDLEVLGSRAVGGNHLKLRVCSGGIHFDAIGFGMAKSLPVATGRISLAFVPELNTWNGITSVQLKIRDVKS